MGRRSTALALIPAIIASLVVAPPNAGAVENGLASTSTESPEAKRERLFALWRIAEPKLKAAAEQVLVGTDAQVADFLADGWKAPSEEDDRDRVVRIYENGGRTVRAAAKRALDANSGDAIRAFLDGGVPAEQALDLRVRVNQMQASAGPNLRAKAQEALDSNSSDVMKKFIETDWEAPHKLDQRVRTNQLVSVGGPRVKQKGQVALDNGTIEALTQFIEHEFPIAQARDLELATVAELAGVAKDAGEQAKRETEAAKVAADRAVAEAELAKESAEKARQATESAQGNANEAAKQAGIAADSANKAASAARDAVGAANAASKAAWVAAQAASRAASAASMAGQAAANAYRAAAAAAVNAGEAAGARAAAQTARDIAVKGEEAGLAAEAAGHAATKAGEAANAAKNAGNNAADAAAAAASAGNFADQAGADATRARNAAATARAAADRANRAADAAIAFASTAAAAATAARAAATQAAKDALAAAQAAEDAAEHAGNAAEAAKKSTEHANAAVAAANTAIEAAKSADKIYQAARVSDEERINTQRDEAVAAAVAAKATVGPVIQASRWDVPSSAKRDGEVALLLVQATAPDASDELVTRNGRKIAVRLLQTSSGEWAKAAAANALSGSDNQVRNFVRVGLKAAEGQDDRVTLRSLLLDGSDAFKRAANTALSGSDADVERFLKERNYPERATEDRIKVNQIHAAATQANRPSTRSAAQKALDAGTIVAYQQFLTKDQFSAAALDDRIEVNRIQASADSGLATKAAAQAALDGPSAFQKKFLSSDRYALMQVDQEQAAHNAEVSAYVSKAWQSAHTATENANRAQEIAANARNAAAEAAAAAQRAQESAAQAATFASNAHNSALAAEKSAQDAANSARTAQQAAQQANNSARQAARSSIAASASAQQARQFAANANQYAQAAYAAKLSATNDAILAEQAKNEAHAVAIRKAEDERIYQALKQGEYCEDRYGAGTDGFNLCVDLVNPTADQLVEMAFRNSAFCETYFGDRKGMAGYQNCLQDTLSQDFMFNRYVDALHEVVAYGKAFAAAMGVMAVTVTLGGYCIASFVCSRLVLGMADEIDPLMATLGPTLVRLGAGTFGTIKLLGQIELTILDTEVLVSRSNKIDLGDLVGTIGKACEPNSFTPNTPVLTADGRSKRIDQIKVGDQVVATDPKSGTTSAQPVSKVIVGEGAKKIVDVRFRSPQGISVLRATYNHPFWVQNWRGWFDAENLRPGMTLRTPDGRQVTVAGIKVRNQQAKVYNLTVAKVSTFYAVAGSTPVLVHNVNCWDVNPWILDQIKADNNLPEAVMKGLNWNIKRYNEGAHSHALNGMDMDEEDIAVYLGQWWRVKFERHDSLQTHQTVFVHYDAEKEILLIKHPGDDNTGMIHAYNFSAAEWAATKDTRYAMGGES